MARHTIPYHDMELVWDDEAGTVEGDSWFAAGVREHLAEGAPLDESRDGHILILEDPAHDPHDFWHLLPYWLQVEPMRSRMPAILRDVEPTPRRPRATSSTASSATPSRARISSGEEAEAHRGRVGAGVSAPPAEGHGSRLRGLRGG